MTSGYRDTEADVLRRADDVDLYGQPSGTWELFKSVWLYEDVVGRNSRASDRDQPSLSTEFIGLAIDLLDVKPSDILRVFYADYQIDAITRVHGRTGEARLVCSVTQESISLSPS